MSTHTTDDVRDEASLPIPADDASDAVPIAAEIVVSRDQPAECTLYPADASGIELMTSWITAHEGSFVSLERMR
ncbi:hypothetical protein SAMN05216388_101728 [Halorientalis persicus]|uniref:DUF7511 domain-containing protein n=1 Tax=Halorientalis persicus TaxID=1367881 RepID=A0A1H8RU97_9EURY|nr:hypothetical protein [Halorientalis persicus]SEO69728.1 hypothetical protein SAMN05216388_101728 [Halorientalis persicus]